MKSTLLALFAGLFAVCPSLQAATPEPVQPRLTVEALPDRSVRLTWSATAGPFLLEQAQQLSSTTRWERVALTPQLERETLAVTVIGAEASRFFRLREGVVPLSTLASSSPLPGEEGVAVTRETIVHFTVPLAQDTLLTTNHFYAGAGGRRLLSRIELSSDRERATLFYLEPLPGGTRVVAVFDGTGLKDATGRPLDADGDEAPGGWVAIPFETLSNTPVPGTAVAGRVFASELVPGSDTGTNAVNKPLAGVTITVDGVEQTLRAVTDAEGRFTLQPVPPGRFFVHIDGRTVREGDRIRYPDKAYYPFVGKAWEAMAGRTNLAGGTGEIFLPLITEGTMQPVSATQDTVISFPPGVVASNPALAGVSITVPANALFADDGTRGGKVGIAPVPPNRLPGPLPPGLEMPIVITVQTDGPLNFDRPAPVCFPNLPDPVLKTPLPAGSKQALISFNHDKGEWEAVGTMTVSADGKLICTDPGSGILQPGWHGVVDRPAEPDPRPAKPRCLREAAGGEPDEDELRHFIDQCVEYCAAKEKQCLRRLVLQFDLEEKRCQAEAEISQERGDRCDQRNLESLISNQESCSKGESDCLEKCKDFAFCTYFPASSRGRGSLSRHSPEEDARIAEELDVLYGRLLGLLEPFHSPYRPIPPEVRGQMDAIRREADTLTGGDRLAFLARHLAAQEEELTVWLATYGLTLGEFTPGNAPPYPVLYAAEITRPGGRMTLRGETDANGGYSLFIPRDGMLLGVSFYDPRTKHFGLVYPRLSPTLSRALPRFTLGPLRPAAQDTDQDGLPDLVEFVYGTDQNLPDSDGDGIPDGVEIDQSTDPLDGRPVRTGIIATARTSGPALDVCVGNGWVATADGAAGVSVFSEYRGGNPTRLAHVPVAGQALRLSSAGDQLLVPLGDAGLSVIDVRNPGDARVVRQTPLPGAQAAVGLGNTACVGLASGLVVQVDLASGLVLDHLSLTNAIWDLAVEGDTLYALTDNRLLAVSMRGDRLAFLGGAEAPVSSPNRRLFVGGGVAYTVHNQGYNTFDLADPAKPVLLATGRTSQFGWLHVVPNGSGLGLAAVGPTSGGNSPRDISLYDVRDPRTNDVFLTTFVTPGIARAAAIHNGLGYVADDTAGLQVVNYLAFDAQRTPPNVELRSGFAVEGVTEGSRAWVTARVTDDVQVRQVEFLLDGQPVSTDGSFPFEFRFIAPALAATKTNFTVQARAVDTGGNFRLSEALVVSLLPDTAPPKVLAHAPRGGARSVDRVQVLLDEPIDLSALTTNSFLVQSAGPDGDLGTTDDVTAGGSTVAFQAENGAAVLAFDQPLPEGLYRATLAPTVTDLAGNALGTMFSWSFRVGDAVYWTGQIDDRWANPLNWSGGRLPGPEDHVVIDAFEGEPAVVHDLDTSRVRSLISHERLQVGTALRRGLLQVDGTLAIHRDLTLDGGGSLQGGIVLQHGEARLRVTNRGGTIDGVRLEGDLVLTNTGARLLTRNGLQLNGTVRIDNGAAIGFIGDQALAQGQIVFEGNSGFVSVDGNSTLTLGPEVLIRGKNVVLGSGHFSGSGFPRLINRGRIAGDLAGGALTVALWSFENAGVVEVAQGHTLLINSQNWSNTAQIAVSGGAKATFAGTWHNAGTLVLNEGTLALGGNFRAAGLGTIQRTGGTIELVGGNLNLEGGSLTLDDSVGSWILRGGTIRNGTLRQEGQAKLLFSNFGGTLDGLTVQGDLDLTAVGTGVALRNGLTLHGRALLDNGGALTILGDQTLHAGEVVFAGSAGVVRIEGSATWTLGPNAAVRGKTGAIGQGFSAGSSRLINQGLIAADVPAGTLTLSPARLENSGTLRADGAGALLKVQVPGFTNTGVIEEFNGGSVAVNP